jgi:GT2 family glycosyltransferase
MTTPRHSFILVSYNTKELTRAAIVSIQRYAEKGTYEIIVADNASSDGTVDMLRRQFPEVKLVETGGNLGFATANNAGAKLATGEWLVLINSDAELLPDTMSKCEEVVADHPAVQVLGGQLLNTDRSLQTSYLLIEGKERISKVVFPEGTIEVDGIVGAFMVIRNEVWKKLGGMDQNFFFYFEETDFCFRVKQAGGLVLWTPRFQVIHHGGGSTPKANPRSKIEFHTSLYYIIEKTESKKNAQLLRRRYTVKTAFNAVGNALLVLLTFGLAPGIKARYQTNVQLCAWHLSGCPRGWGMRPRS